MNDWSTRVHQALAAAARMKPVEAISMLADLAFEVNEEEGNAFLEAHPECFQHYEFLHELYCRHVVANETEEARNILAKAAGTTGSFKQLAGAKGVVAYDRNADMFNHVDFDDCETVVMVGCGPLPVTALHVLERSRARSVVCLDVAEAAIESTNQLKAALDLGRIQTRLSNGTDYDFGAADAVYIANMVSPKLQVVKQALRTSAPGTRLVVREPYSLGRLWTERTEHELGSLVEITGRGPASRHLSRDVYMRTRGRPPDSA